MHDSPTKNSIEHWVLQNAGTRQKKWNSWKKRNETKRKKQLRSIKRSNGKRRRVEQVCVDIIDNYSCLFSSHKEYALELGKTKVFAVKSFVVAIIKQQITKVSLIIVHKKKRK